MNPERLLQHFETISEAPDAVARLRRFILDLAVRGKLVKQEAEDQPASELIQLIAVEKLRLLKAGAIRKEKPLSPVYEDAHFNVPAKWQWTRLGVVTTYIQRGKSPKYAVSDGSPVVSQRCVQWAGLDMTAAREITLESLTNYEETRFLRDGDLLWNSTGTGTIGRVIRLIDPPERLVCDSHVTVVRCLLVDPEYVRIWLRSDSVYARIEGRAAGSTNQVELTALMAVNQVLPLPPLAEQHRIVAKVGELMALCDQLQAARDAREEQRDRLAAASLSRLTANGAGGGDTAGHAIQRVEQARFHLQHLPRLSANQQHLKQLREAILSFAVCGKLVPQDIVNEKVGSPYCGEPASIDLPTNWRLLNFGKYCDIQGGNQPPKSQFVREPRSGYIQLLQIRDFGQRPVPTFIPIGSTNRFCKRGEILIGRYGASVGKIIWARDGAYNVAMAKFVWPDDSLIARFVFLLLESKCLQGPLSNATRSAQAGFNKGDLAAINFPLPPIAEQHRIVAKFDELMALCDQLEASLVSTQANRTSLLDALLHEALEPAVDAAA